MPTPRRVPPPDFPEAVPWSASGTDRGVYSSREYAEDRPENGSSSMPTKKDRFLRKVIENGLLALLIFSPLPAASVERWSITVIELGAIALTLLYLFVGRTPNLNDQLKPKLKWPMLIFSALFLFIGAQMVPLPRLILQTISPASLSLRKLFIPNFSDTSPVPLSLVPSQTLRTGLELLSYFLIGFLVVKTVTRGRQIRKFILGLILMGTFEAFYGFFELYRSHPHILFYKKVFSLDSVTGTFVNRNHFSGYLEMILPLALGLVISRINLFSMPGKKWKDRIAQMAAQGFAVNVFVVLSILVMALAIFRSNSRSGVFLLVFTFFLFFTLTVYSFGVAKYRQIWIKTFLKVTIVLVTLIALYVGVDSTVRRFSRDNLLQDGRPKYWADVLNVIGDFPLLGSGLGTFPSVFSAYDYTGLDGPLVHAHNDYLENFSELGLVGFTLLMAGLIFIAVDAFKTWAKRKNPEIKGLGLGLIVAVAVMAFHSITDFNLHIPANILLFTVVLSLAWTTAYYRKRA